MSYRLPPFLLPAVAAAAILVCARPSVVAQEPTLAEVLTRAATAAAVYADPTRVIYCEERYKQSMSRLIYPADGRVETKPIDSREWVAEFAIVATPSEEPRGFPWMEFRDIISVQGKVQRDGVSRLGVLATKPFGAVVNDVFEYTKRSADLQFGEMSRAPLLPREAALFLHAVNQARFDFKKGGTRTINGVKTWEIKYQEKAAPTVLTNSAGQPNAPSSGSLWVDPVTGRVCASLLRNADKPKLSDEMTVTYGADQATGLWLPVSMKHKTAIEESEETVEGEATYKKCRAEPRKGG